MDKSSIKTKYDPFRGRIITDLIRETGLSPSFIRQAIKGDRTSETAEKIRREFKIRYNKIQEALKSN